MRYSILLALAMMACADEITNVYQPALVGDDIADTNADAAASEVQDSEVGLDAVSGGTDDSVPSEDSEVEADSQPAPEVAEEIDTSNLGPCPPGFMPTVERVAACFDGVDNDCDNYIDAVDPDCELYCQPASGECDQGNPDIEYWCDPNTYLCRSALKIPTCAEITCDDGNSCTTDLCLMTENGPACSHSADAACDQCVTDGNCEDGDPCTINTCAPTGMGKQCFKSTNIECVPDHKCFGNADCADGDPCTDDYCVGNNQTGNFCSNPVISNCPSPSACSSEIDCGDYMICASWDQCIAPDMSTWSGSGACDNNEDCAASVESAHWGAFCSTAADSPSGKYCQECVDLAPNGIADEGCTSARPHCLRSTLANGRTVDRCYSQSSL